MHNSLIYFYSIPMLNTVLSILKRELAMPKKLYSLLLFSKLRIEQSGLNQILILDITAGGPAIAET